MTFGDDRPRAHTGGLQRKLHVMKDLETSSRWSGGTGIAHWTGMSGVLKTKYHALVEAVRILFGRPEARQPSGTGGAVG